MIDYQKILENLGYVLSDRGEYWQTTAIFRNGDNPFALQIYKNSGVWKDFVEDSVFYPFEVLVKKTLNTTDEGLVKNTLNGSKNIQSSFKAKNLLKEEKSFNKSCLQRLLPHFDFYLNRGISRETLEDYQCGLASSGPLYQRIVFPIFRSDGKIHGFSGRLALDGDNRPKWLHKGKSSSWFFPFYTTKKTASEILRTKTVYLVESVGDSVSLYDKGIPQNLVTFGLTPSPKVISWLSSLPLEKIFIAYNNDYESVRNRGLEGAIKAAFKLMETVDINKIYLCLPQKNDFGQMDQQDIDLYLKRSKNLSHKESMELILSTSRDMIKTLKVPKAFIDSFKRFEKKYEFIYD